MEYKKKIEIAERIADQLQGSKTTEEIRSDLKSEGFYEPDIVEILISARKILGNKYLPIIKQHLLDNKEIKGSLEFTTLDDDLIDRLITTEIRNLEQDEKKKITKLVKEDVEGEEILKLVDTRFLSLDKAVVQINALQEVKDQNSGSGRMLNIFGGVALILIAGAVFFTSGRLFYVVPIIGLYLIIKGFTTQDTHYDS